MSEVEGGALLVGWSVGSVLWWVSEAYIGIYLSIGDVGLKTLSYELIGDVLMVVSRCQPHFITFPSHFSLQQQHITHHLSKKKDFIIVIVDQPAGGGGL